MKPDQSRQTGDSCHTLYCLGPFARILRPLSATIIILFIAQLVCTIKILAALHSPYPAPHYTIATTTLILSIVLTVLIVTMTIIVNSSILALSKRCSLNADTCKNNNLLFADIADIGIATHRMIVDDLENPVDFIFLSVNRGFETITGLSREQCIGRKASEVLPGIETTGIIQRFGTVAHSGESINFEYFSPQRDRLYKINAYQQEPGLFTSVLSDITKTNRLEADLRLSHSIVENIQIGLHIYHFEDIGDDRTLRLVYVNPACESILQVKKEDLVGKTLDENFPGLREQHIPQRYAEVVRSKITRTFEDVVYSDDRILRAAFSVKAFALPNNHCGVAFEDITARVQAETEIRESHRKLAAASIRSERMAEEAQNALVAKNNFLSNISHELRTPLHAMLGMLEVLLVKTTAEDLRRHVHTTYRCGEALLTVIDNLIDLTALESNELTLMAADFNLDADVVFIVNQLFREQAALKNLEFSIDIAVNVPLLLRGDAKRTRQILVKLVENALKFTTTGRISIMVKAEADEETSATLRFTVTDTGIGIPEEKLSGIFDKFSQVDDSSTRLYQGTGLGLAICRHLVTGMGGAIEVESREGVGSKFSFSIRFGKQQPQDGAAITSPPSGTAERCTSLLLKGKTVLVVEDNDFNSELVVLFLNELGMAPAVVKNGREALTILDKRSFDLILMDCQMPIMDGFEATRIIRSMSSAYKTIPIIALTANITANDREQCLVAGMNDFVSKPFTKKQLSAVLVKWLTPSSSAGSLPDAATVMEISGDPTEKSLVWNRAAFLEMVQNDEAIAARVIAEFIIAIPRLYNALADAITAEELKTIERTAHSIKGAAATISAETLRQCAASMEKCAKSGVIDEAQSRLKLIEGNFDELRNVLERDVLILEK